MPLQHTEPGTAGEGLTSEMNLSIRDHARRASISLVSSVTAAILILGSLYTFGGFPQSPLIAVLLVMAAVVVIITIGSLRLTRFTDRVADVAGRMTETTREISKGDLNRSIAVEEINVEELRALGAAINATAMRARGDIAEMKRLERVRSEFLGNVSHELRTPIFSVQGYLETLLDGAADDPTVRDDFLYKAHQNVLRLHTLLTDLIEISRIESGEMKMSFRYFDAVEYLQGILAELEPTAEIANVNLELKVAGGRKDVQVLGDRDRLKQALVNLVENAIKYNTPNGTVTVELEASKAEAVIRVRDTGIGIPHEDLGRIFERFYRVNKDRSRAVGGSGLGLAIVKHIVEAHGSTVRVESELGTGSTFSFTLKR